jgi:hypothetical protein
MLAMVSACTRRRSFAARHGSWIDGSREALTHIVRPPRHRRGPRPPVLALLDDATSRRGRPARELTSLDSERAGVAAVDDDDAPVMNARPHRRRAAAADRRDPQAPEPALQDALEQPDARRGRPESPVEVGLDVAGRDRVHLDAVTCPFHREHARQVDQAGLRRRVRRQVPDRAQAHDRRDVHDPTGTLGGDERTGDGLRDEPCAAQVRREDGVPVGFGQVERCLRDADAGVVHEDVDRAERRRSLRARSADRLRRRDVHLDGRRVSTCCRDLRHQRLERGTPPRRHRDRGAACGERRREVPAESRGGAGDEGDASGEREAIFHRRRS